MKYIQMMRPDFQAMYMSMFWGHRITVLRHIGQFMATSRTQPRFYRSVYLVGITFNEQQIN